MAEEAVPAALGNRVGGAIGWVRGGGRVWTCSAIARSTCSAIARQWGPPVVDGARGGQGKQLVQACGDMATLPDTVEYCW
jgi:hypothetical protein